MAEALTRSATELWRISLSSSSALCHCSAFAKELRAKLRPRGSPTFTFCLSKCLEMPLKLQETFLKLEENASKPRGAYAIRLL